MRVVSSNPKSTTWTYYRRSIMAHYMGNDMLRALLAVLEALRPALTRPGFSNMLVVFSGWVLTSGTHAITQALVAAKVAGRRHHETFHRFFSRGAWCADELGRLLFLGIVQLLPPDVPIRVVLDDTVTAHKGPHVFGIGSHVDAVRSTRRRKVFVFGHCWVVLAVLVPVPFSPRLWAVPILLRLCRNEKECKRKGEKHVKKTELARQMLDKLVGWLGERRIEVAADEAFSNCTVMKGLPSSVTLFGTMRLDAVLTALPSPEMKQPNGRPRVKGAALPRPRELASDDSVPWRRTTAVLYGKTRSIYYKMIDAQWYRAAGGQLLRIIVVRCDSGSIPFRAFFSTNPLVTVSCLLTRYGWRWNIEVLFRELKQLLGFGHSSSRKRAAVERIAPFVALSYSILVLWAWTAATRCRTTRARSSCTARLPSLFTALLPVRPWYRHKAHLSFADILRAAQHTLSEIDVLDLVPDLANLRKTPPAVRAPRAA